MHWVNAFGVAAGAANLAVFAGDDAAVGNLVLGVASMWLGLMNTWGEA